jgi:hypothetical protein
MSDTLDRIVPEAGPNGEALYRHDAEGTLWSSFWSRFWCIDGRQGKEIKENDVEAHYVQDPTIFLPMSSRR